MACSAVTVSIRRPGEKRERERGERRTTLAHQLLGDAQAAVGAHDGQRRDVAVLHAVGRLLLHLGEHIADDLGVVVGRLGRARHVDGDV
jgi:hypothetical protein